MVAINEPDNPPAKPISPWLRDLNGGGRPLDLYLAMLALVVVMAFLVVSSDWVLRTATPSPESAPREFAHGYFSQLAAKAGSKPVDYAPPVVSWEKDAERWKFHYRHPHDRDREFLVYVGRDYIAGGTSKLP